MLDSSVDDRIFGWMKSFVRDFVLQLDIDSGQWRVGGLTFDSRSRADFYLNRFVVILPIFININVDIFMKIRTLVIALISFSDIRLLVTQGKLL
jgi:hypothetical protein